MSRITSERWTRIFDNPERDAWQKPAHVVELLEIEPGMTIADIVTTYGNQINANRIDLNFGNGDVLKILATGILPADLRALIPDL